MDQEDKTSDKREGEKKWHQDEKTKTAGQAPEQKRGDEVQQAGVHKSITLGYKNIESQDLWWR